MRLPTVYRLLLTGLVVALTGCRGSVPTDFVPTYERITLSDAPEAVQTAQARLRSVPGLYVLDQGQETYLLLLAGRVADQGGSVELVDLQGPVDRTNQARIIARLTPGSEEEAFPNLVLKVQRTDGVVYKVRLLTLTDQVLELNAIPIAEE